MVLLISLGALVATFLGGLFAIRTKDKLHLILGFSAGAVLGVAFFDLMPEALNLGSGQYSFKTLTAIIMLGFVLFMVLDRFLHMHSHDHEDEGHHDEAAKSGAHGALALALHSFLDGVGIGLAFKVSPTVGAFVATAVLVHDFSDGINTVNYILKNKGKDAAALYWLTLDAMAPVLGVLSTYFFTVKDTSLGLILALFCGFFLYIGASDLLPESHHQHPKLITTLMSLLGIAVLYVAIHFAS